MGTKYQLVCVSIANHSTLLNTYILCNYKTTFFNQSNQYTEVVRILKIYRDSSGSKYKFD